MKIAATASLYADPNDPIVYRGAYPQICTQIEEDGFNAVEIHIEDSLEISRAVLWNALKNHHLQLTSIGTGAVFFSRGYSLAHPDAEIRKLCIEHLVEHMKTAEPFGSVIIVGCVQGRILKGQTKDSFLTLLADSMHQLDKSAQFYGVTIGLEIMNRFESDALNRIDEGMTFIQANHFQKTFLHLDTVHMNIEEANIGDAIRRAGKYVGHVHLADNDRWYPGHAHYNFPETIGALQDIGYKGALALEVKPYPDARTSSRLSLEFLRHIMPQG